MERIIQIGSNKGVTDNDPLCQGIVSGMYKGILVEPNPKAFRVMVECYKDIEGLLFEEAAIGTYDGKITMYIPNFDDSWHGTTQHASLYPEQLGEYERSGSVVTPVEVPCLTLNTLIDKHCFHDFDILWIDTEGHDADILLATDFSRFSVKRVVFEYIHIGGPHRRGQGTDKLQRTRDHLRHAGFQNVKIDGEDEYWEKEDVR